MGRFLIWEWRNHNSSRFQNLVSEVSPWWRFISNLSELASESKKPVGNFSFPWPVQFHVMAHSALRPWHKSQHCFPTILRTSEIPFKLISEKPAQLHKTSSSHNFQIPSNGTVIPCYSHNFQIFSHVVPMIHHWIHSDSRPSAFPPRAPTMSLGPLWLAVQGLVNVQIKRSLLGVRVLGF